MDVGNAFLKGLNFEALADALRRKGIVTPMRKVYVVLPLNVWRHFRAIPDCPWKTKRGEEADWILEAVKPSYG